VLREASGEKGVAKLDTEWYVARPTRDSGPFRPIAENAFQQVSHV
jgi:hypothetical protein